MKIDNIDAQVWPKISQALHQHYDVVYWCDIGLDDLDLNLDRLYDELKPFANARFSNQQRIVVVHREVDYYPSVNEHGFALWNLFKIFSSLNIPTEYTLLLTSQPSVCQEAAQLARYFNVPEMTAKFMPYQWWPQPHVISNIDINVHQVTRAFVCLNGQSRMHRTYLLCKLLQNQLLDKGLVSYHPKYHQIAHDIQLKKNSARGIQGLHLRTTHPPTRLNDSMTMRADQHDVYQRFYDQACANHSHPLIQGQPWDTNDPAERYQPSWLQHALWNLVTETVGEYPHSFLTEKTIKAVLTKRPFMIVGGANSLAHMRDCGFRTFDKVISERYSHQHTVADRIDCVVQELKRFCDMDPSQLQDFFLGIQDIVEFNFNHYIETFATKDLDEFVRDLLY